MPAADPLDFLPPRLDGRLLALGRIVMPLWMRRSSGIESVTVRHPERLVEAMRAFQAGENRLLLAFRHPSLDDPVCLGYLLWRQLPREGRALGVRFRPAPHAQFLYDRGIPLWAGRGTGWLLCHLGGCSILRGKLDMPALRTARELLLQGPHPFAAAPEGATNGHNEVVSALEPGVAQLAFWTAEDLARSGRREGMTVLPIGLQYAYVHPVWGAIEALLSQLELEAGLPPDPAHGIDPAGLYRRLMALAERMLALMEAFYRKAYRQDLPPSEAPLPWRLQRLLDAALKVVEGPFGVEARGSLGERCRRLEQAGWDRLYPAANGAACPLERGLADRLAEETERRMWHMRVVEAFEAVSGHYVEEHPSQERFADTLLLLWDTQCRIRGGNPGARPRLGRRRALVTVGEPLPVSGRLEAYRRDRRAAVAALTTELQELLQGMVVPSLGAGPWTGSASLQAGSPQPAASRPT